MDSSNVATILEVVSPSQFFIRPIKMRDEYEAMDDSLQLFYTNVANYTGDQQLKRGLLVVEHGLHFYRARFLGINEQPDIEDATKGSAFVYLYDEGRCLSLPFAACRGIHETFITQRMYCIRCHLANVEPVDGAIWLSEAITFFKNLIHDIHRCDVLFRASNAEVVYEGWTSMAIDLKWSEAAETGPFSQQRSNDVYMSQKMIRAEMAVYSYAKDHEEPLDNLSSLNEALLEANDETIRCSSTPCQGQVTCSTSEETEMNELQEVKHWDPPLIRSLPKTEYIKIRVTHMDDMAQIYYQRHEDRYTLRRMRTVFASLYNASTKDNPMGPEVTKRQSWKVDDACVSKYCNNEWYRGRVLLRIDANNYIVYFVDYGHAYPCKLNEMWVPFHFAHVPSLCCRIILDSIVPITGDRTPNSWEKEVIDTMYDYIAYSNNKEVKFKYTAEPEEDLPAKAALKVYPDNSRKSVDFVKYIISLNQGQLGPIDMTLYKDRYSTAANGLKGILEPTQA